MRASIPREIFKELASAIVTGAIPPTQKLDEQAIAKRFSVSRTPVREALRQLNGAGLVEARPGGGFAVAGIDANQLAAMFETLGELEGLCAKLSALRMSEIERHKLAILNRDCSKAVTANDLAGFAACNELFHQMIYSGAHNLSLAQITTGFRQRLAPFRVPTFYLIEGRLQASVQEHRTLVEAIAAGNAEAACQAMRAHVASASVSVIDHFEKVRAAGLEAPANRSTHDFTALVAP